MAQFSFFNVLMEVACILNQFRKLFLKNKKLMFSVLAFPLLLNGLVYLFSVLDMKPEITNLNLEDPSTPEFIGHLMRVYANYRQLVLSSNIFSFVSSIIILLSVIAIVHASALGHKDENIKIKDFLVLTLQSWKGPLVTNFDIIFFSLGYWFLFFIILFLIHLFSSNFDSWALWILWLLFVIFESYLAIVWNLSMVISILEETYGIQALRKAAKIVKGMKPKLFLLNLFFGLLAFGLAQIVRLVDLRRSFAVTLTTGLVLVSLVFTLKMFQQMSYTVAYFQCTSFQGKDVESLGDVEYTNLSSGLLMGTLP